jgi:hypothetical protein
VNEATIERAYTILVSSIPSLYRAVQTSPNPLAAHLHDDLLRHAIDWVQAFQRDTGRTVDNFSEYGYP